MKPQAILIGGAAVVVTIGYIAVTQLDNWFTPEPTGPGSGDEMPVDEPTGPGSGDEIDPNEPTGPGSGDEMPADEPTGPGSGDEIDPNEPTGPGSGDEMPADEPTGPGSGDEVDPNEPTGPGSGDEIHETSLMDGVIGSCNTIDDASTCVEYRGSFWATPEIVEHNCDGVGVYSARACPRPTSGGCRVNADNSYEFTSWFYPYGGDPIVGDLIGYASAACNASGGQYVFTD